MQLESCEIKGFSSTQENLTSKPHFKKYVKITEEVKETFLKFIIDSNMSIKKASEALRINYSSAKAILSSHKKLIRVSKTDTSDHEESSARSSYRVIPQTNLLPRAKFSVTCSVGGKEMESSPIRKTKIIFKPEILVPVRSFVE